MRGWTDGVSTPHTRTGYPAPPTPGAGSGVQNPTPAYAGAGGREGATLLCRVQVAHLVKEEDYRRSIGPKTQINSKNNILHTYVL